MSDHWQYIGINHDYLLQQAIVHLIVSPEDEVTVRCQCRDHKLEPVGGSRHQQRIIDELIAPWNKVDVA